MQIFCDRLKELRKADALTHKDLAEILHTTNSSVCDWERGRAEPSLDMLVMLSKYFEVSVDYMLGLVD